MRLFTISFLANLAVLGIVVSSFIGNQDGYITLTKKLNNIKNDVDSLWGDYDLQYGPKDSLFDKTLEVRNKINQLHFIQADSITIFGALTVSNNEGDLINSTQKIAVKDIRDLTHDELAKKYNKTSFRDKLFFLQYLWVSDDQKGMIPLAIGNLLWMMILLLQTLAFIMHL